MAVGISVLTIVLLLFLYLFLPLGLMVILFALSRKYRGMFDQIGFSRKEMGLLIVGSLSTLLVPAELPLIAFRDYFLAINLGGAIIPTVLSIHLLRAKRIAWQAWLPGVLGVSVLTFLITRVQPNAGIVAEFPYIFLPAVASTIFALVLYSRSSAQAPAFAYATATLGSLIGADAFHLPELFQAREFTGSIGGASVFDLVYIGGLLSFALVLVFVTSRLRRLERQIPHAEAARDRVTRELRSALTALVMGRYQLAAQRSLGAVQERLGQLGRVFGKQGTYPDLLRQLNPDPNLHQLYGFIATYANDATLDYHRARWTLHESQVLLDRLQTVERARYAGIGRRAAAFSIDGVFLLGLVALLGLFVYPARRIGPELELGAVLFAFFFWAWSVQVVYFTLFEYFWGGATPGKRLFRIRVADLSDRAPDFITAFTRNTVRILDFLLLFYAVSLLFMATSPRLQRLGDRVADTVVLRKTHNLLPAVP